MDSSEYRRVASLHYEVDSEGAAKLINQCSDENHQVEIYRVTSISDCREVQRLASRVWGPGAACSEAQMTVHAQYGGVVLLACVRREPVGFLFSFPALYKGEAVLWSHETAVIPVYRDFGIGKALKLRQREAASDLGYNYIAWTYDPLVSRNANFNINKLGAQVTEYKENAYGSDEDDQVNRGIETDRFIVLWNTDVTAHRAEAGCQEWGDSVCVLHHCSGLPSVSALGDTNSSVDGVAFVETQIPGDFSTLIERDADTAKLWRTTFRDVAVNLLSQGFSPIGYRKKLGHTHGSYIWGKSGGGVL